MKLGILSRAPNSYSTRRLRQAAAERGHDGAPVIIKLLEGTQGNRRCAGPRRQGGRGHPLSLDPEFERTAVRAAQIMGLRVGGWTCSRARTAPWSLR